MTGTPPLARRLLSAFLAVLVIGSSVAAQTRSPNDVGLQLFETPPPPQLLVIFSLARTKRTHRAGRRRRVHRRRLLPTAPASFANPAIGVGRMFSNTFAGIAPASVPGYIVAQLLRDPSREGPLPRPDAGRGSRGRHGPPPRANGRLDPATPPNLDAQPAHHDDVANAGLFDLRDHQHIAVGVRDLHLLPWAWGAVLYLSGVDAAAGEQLDAQRSEVR